MREYDNDHLYRELTDVINYDPKFRKWYLVTFFIICQAYGTEQVLKLAAIARADGKTEDMRKRIFTARLNKYRKLAEAKQKLTV